MDKITITKLQEMKKNGEKITMLTSYDYGMTKIINEAGTDVILVGDSIGMVKLGYENTLPVTVNDILYHCKIVRRANSRCFLIADMPFMSFEVTGEDAVANAGRLVKDGGAQAVKIEGGKERIETIKAILSAKIPVMGHIGLTPQAINQLGEYKVQGKNEESAHQLIETALMLQETGIFSLVLECVPISLAKDITSKLSIPTIGIGAGPYCDGQVLVLDDILGLYSDSKPKFVKRYLNLKPMISEAVKQYCQEVKTQKFPAEENSYK